MPALFRVEAIGFLPFHRRRVRSEDVRIDPQCPTNVRKEGGLEAAPFGGRHTADLRVEAVSVMDIVVDLDRKENRRQHDAVSIVRRQDSRCCADPSVDVDKGDDESLVGAQAVAMDTVEVLCECGLRAMVAYEAISAFRGDSLLGGPTTDDNEGLKDQGTLSPYRCVYG